MAHGNFLTLDDVEIELGREETGKEVLYLLFQDPLGGTLAEARLDERDAAKFVKGLQLVLPFEPGMAMDGPTCTLRFPQTSSARE